MRFNGREAQALVGAIVIFQHIPLSRTQKRNLTEVEYDTLENLFDRVMTLLEKKYKRIGADSLEGITPENLSDSDVIRKRISIILDIPFSRNELKLINEALIIYISEAESRKNGKSMNVYHGGDMYGLDTDDFINLAKRLKEEKSNSRLA